jgi:guanylate kinase
VLDIDIQGVQNVKKSPLDCKYLFISPPDMLELERRLVNRNTESMEKIKLRLENAVGEIEYGHGGHFDKVLVNVELEETYREILATLQKWYPDLDLCYK